ncbi:Hsp20/alpha crystallin family protein [Natrarchaeobius halalkaliphilus]|uniref:Hsp20/alpha crystallin family protein n=1 Tax=Natrarchaeobius halalkaliphilus TaxID=1679091 RepID=A0A3N6M3B4_9EURY|nr:Hsp20/alpha crystallin family protein [Natrarchaeobius halalkaliphilus]RQG86183.1 Hsp20/alpha crystallin family protein [Natrarchaeobius halalkaliphilus]
MNIEHFAHETGQAVRRYEYDDHSMLAVDFGPRSEATVDLVGGTVIVVDGGDQYELELPDDAGDAHTFMKNGVLTIELEADL